VVSFVLAVAVFNLALGFAVAVYLGKHKAAPQVVNYESFGDLFPPQTPATDAVAAPQPSAVEPAKEPVEETAEETIAPPEEFPAAEAESEPLEEAPEWPPQAELEDLEATLVRLSDDVAAHQQKVLELETELRRNLQQPRPEPVSACLGRLEEAVEQYVVDRNKHHRRFGELCGGSAALAPLADRVQTAMNRQDKDVTALRNAIADFDPEVNLAEGCQFLHGRTLRLQEGNHSLRDTLGKTMAELLRHDEKSDATDFEAYRDEATGLPGRAALELWLHRHRQTDEQRAAPLSSVVIDVDLFGRLNEEYGCEVGDRVLRALADLVRQQTSEPAMAFRYAGQRFGLLLPETPAESAIKAAERLRQTVEEIRFTHGEQEFRMALSCGVTQAKPDDSVESLLRRTEETLQEAKRYGGNRTFLRDGQYPAPVAPPHVDVEPRDVEV